MKQRKNLLLPLLAGSLLAASLCEGAVVFLDTFSQTAGTLIVGKSPDVGSGAWTSGGGANDSTLAVSSLNTADTAGKSVAVFGAFTSALGAGQIITLQYDTLAPASGSFLPGNTSWGGISLYSGHTIGGSGTEGPFTGNPSAGFWGTDNGNNSGVGRHFGTDTNEYSHATFTYVYSTGAWTFSTSTGYSTSGTANANKAFNGLRLGCGTARPNVDNISVDISSVATVAFGAALPVDGSYSGSRASVSLQAFDGNPVTVNTNTIVMKVDGGTVTPVITKSANITTINYLPGSPLSAGALHTARVTLADSGGALYTNAWSFTTGFPSLPATLPGPITVAYATNGDNGIRIFGAGDDWIGANYGASSGRTIYARFSVNFNNLNGEIGGGGGYGGLHFFLGGTPHVIAGNAWLSTSWSADFSDGNQIDLSPVTPVVFNTWHTIVERVDYTPSGNATVNIWLDPDFTQTEANQPQAPLTHSVVDTFDNIALRAGNGTNITVFSNITMSATSAGAGFVAPADPQFANLIPASGAPSAYVNTPIGAQVVFGTYGIGTNTVVLTLDGSPVTPTFVVATNSITVNYQPPTTFAPTSSHTVALSVTDSNGAPYSTSWSFSVDAYPTLPVTIPGPIDVVYGQIQPPGAGITIFGVTNGWIANNYQSTSTNTLYTYFSMEFLDLNGETTDGVGTCYGGLHFFQGDTTERLLTGESWVRNTWSIDDKQAGGELALAPTNVVVINEYHTMAIKSVYSNGGPATETIWLDPDFTKSEGNQLNQPLVVSMDNTFDNIRLRCGNGSAATEFSNIVVTATSPFAVAVPGVLSLQNLSGNVNLSWTSTGTLQTAPEVIGPWTDFGNQSNPQIIITSNSATFFRLRQ